MVSIFRGEQRDNAAECSFVAAFQLMDAVIASSESGVHLSRASDVSAVTPVLHPDNNYRHLHNLADYRFTSILLVT